SRRLPARPAVRRPPLHRPQLRSDHLHDLRARRARQHDRRLRCRLHHEPDHRHRRLLLLDRDLLRPRLRLLHRPDVHPAARHPGAMMDGAMRASMTARVLPLLLAVVVLAAVPLVTRDYFLHIAIQILLWGFIYTAWSLMGKFGLVSLGHGAFLGIGAYVPALLWNFHAVTPWLGIPLAVLLAVLLALVIGYPCFRLRVIGHYFALVTLALSQVVL